MHLRYSPSGAKRWLKCPGSLNVERRDGDNESEYSSRGTILHTVAENCVRDSTDPMDLVGQSFEGYTLTEEDATHVKDYCDTVKRWVAFANYDADPLLEQFVEHPELENFGGTIDCLIDTPNMIVIVDFKAGMGVYVDPVENPQLMSYMCCVREPGDTREMWVVVVQPAALGKPRRSWQVTHEQLDAFEQEVKNAIDIDKSGVDLVVLDDGKHCQFCPRMAVCPELERTVAEIYSCYLEGGTITPERMAELITLKPVITAFFRAMEQKAIAYLEEGTTLVPGFKLVDGKGRRKWTASEEEVIDLLREKGFDVDDLPRKLPTPTQVAKVFGLEAVEGVSEQPDSGVKLVPESHAAVGVDQASVQRMFENE